MQGDPMWLEEPQDQDRGRTGSRRWLVLVIAAVPWMVVAALVLLPRDAPHDPPSTVPEASEAPEAPEVSEHPVPPVDEPPTATAADPPSGSSPPSDQQPPRGAGSTVLPALPEVPTPDRDRLAATATVVARAWLTGVAPHLGLGGLDPVDATSYAEHLVVEAIDHRDPHLAVVSLLAVLLREEPDGLTVDHRRVAVPLAIEDGSVRLVGSPWWLPAPDLEVVDLPAEERSDPAWVDAAVDGLLAAGLEDVEVRGLERTSRWPWRADVVATTPEGERIDGSLWLRWTEHGFLLAGLPDHDGAPPVPPEDGPPDQPSDHPPSGSDAREIDP